MNAVQIASSFLRHLGNVGVLCHVLLDGSRATNVGVETPRDHWTAADLFATYSIGEETGEAEIGPLSVLARGYRALLIVNGEPTNLRVAPATMGWFFFRFTVEG
jgi:hypothetical protein